MQRPLEQCTEELGAFEKDRSALEALEALAPLIGRFGALGLQKIVQLLIHVLYLEHMIKGRIISHMFECSKTRTRFWKDQVFLSFLKSARKA